MKIFMAQVNVIPGNPSENLATVTRNINKAKSEGAELIIFPEMVIPGYLLGDMWERSSFVKECVRCNQEIAKQSDGITIIWGNVHTDDTELNEDGRIRKYNCALIAQDGAILDIVVKTLQPNYREFDDNRYFYDARKRLLDDSLGTTKSWGDTDELLEELFTPIYINETNVGIMLCEDGWDSDYNLSPSDRFIDNGAEMLINISCSPYTYNKNNKRNRLFTERAQNRGVPIVYVNNVGVQNNGKTVYAFDGNSCIYDIYGKQLSPYEAFNDGGTTVDIALDEEFGDQIASDDNIGTLYTAIKFGTKGLMEQLGIKRVVIGASGGIDSALAAAIYSDILDPKDMLLVNMPSQYNSGLTKDLARELAANIGCKYVVTPIQESVDLTKLQISTNNIIDDDLLFGGLDDEDAYLTPFMMENVQARDRSSRVLAAWASKFGGVFTCNGNKSEMTVGYATLYGDVGGWFAMLGDLWKTQVYDMARYINKQAGREIIPQGTIDLIPSAELSADQDITKGEGDPFNYAYHDLLFASWVERWDRATPEDILKWYLDGSIERELGWFNKLSIAGLFDNSPAKFIEDLERWWKCHNGLGVAKRIQAPPVMAVSRRAYGFDMRESQCGVRFSPEYLRMKEEVLNTAPATVMFNQAKNRFKS